MRNEYNNLIELIRQWGVFEKQTEIADLETFAVWILKQKTNGTVHSKSNGNGNGHHANGSHSNGNGNGTASHQSVESQINGLVLRIARFSEIYLKSFFKNEKLSFNEFRVLSVLEEHHLLKKNEVIAENLFETTTGTTIIKNLVEKNYLEEVDDNSDKRIKRVQLSPRGKVLYDDVKMRFDEVIRLITGNLGSKEKEALRTHLIYLNDFHNKIHTVYKNEPLEELISRFVMSD